MYCIDKEKLSKRPEIRIGDKVYEIDNRLSVYKRINERLKAEGGMEIEVIIGEGLGSEVYGELVGMDLPYCVMVDIVIGVLAGLQDVSLEEARGRFRPGGV